MWEALHKAQGTGDLPACEVEAAAPSRLLGPLGTPLGLSQWKRASSTGNQASSRGEAKDTALLSSRDGYILELTVWPKGSQASCEVWRDTSCEPLHPS